MKLSLVHIEMEDNSFFKLVIGCLIVCLIFCFVFLYRSKDFEKSIGRDLTNKEVLPGKLLEKEKINHWQKSTNESQSGFNG